MYKLVTVDLDGTLLNSYGEVTENTKEKKKNTRKRCRNNDSIRKTNRLNKNNSRRNKFKKIFHSRKWSYYI